MSSTPYPFDDFLRAKGALRTALIEHPEPFALLTGDTGSGKTALLRELRTELDRARHRVLYFSEARKLGAPGLVCPRNVSLGSKKVRRSAIAYPNPAPTDKPPSP